MKKIVISFFCMMGLNANAESSEIKKIDSEFINFNRVYQFKSLIGRLNNYSFSYDYLVRYFSYSGDIYEIEITCLDKYKCIEGQRFKSAYIFFKDSRICNLYADSILNKIGEPKSFKNIQTSGLIVKSVISYDAQWNYIKDGVSRLISVQCSSSASIRLEI